MRQPLLAYFTAVLGLLIGSSLQASESTDLALFVQQLDRLESIALRNESRSSDSSRYAFNYPRFSEDLEHIRSGIRDYLSPVRAQPRDPFGIKGDYRLESPDGHAE